MLSERTLTKLAVLPPLRLDEWTEEYRYLSPEAAAEPGKYQISRAEYQRGIMEAISDPTIKEVTLMTSAQVGKTEILLNIIGYHIHYDPAPILAVQPTLSMAQSFSKERIANMIRDCPALKGKVKAARTRDSGNTTLHKSFPSGHITICGANSPSSLASRPIRIVLLDEVDRYPPSAGSEGDPVRLATKRSQTFWNSKKVMVSTPTVKDASRIEAAFLETDQRHFHVPCKKCGHYQVLRWKYVIFDADQTVNAKYQCSKCGDLWTDVQRWTAVRNGVWRATLGFNSKAGFHLNELYSSWSTLQGMVENFLEAKKLPETLKTFINTTLAETWEDQGEGLEEILFMDRREKYKPDFLPKEILLVTAGVDVQDNRLEIETIGWGLGEECWSIEYNIIYGDPSAPGLWRQLDDHLTTKYKRMDGLELPILSAAIDSGGHYTQAVYNFCRKKAKRRIWAIKGQAGQGKAVWPKRPSVRNIGRVPLYSIGVDSAKDIVFARLKVEEKGNGYCHFPMYDEEYFLQLTAEKVVITYSKGVPVRAYKAFRRRNEALDCRVYGYACFVGLQANLSKVKESQDAWVKENSEKLSPNIAPSKATSEEGRTKGERKELLKGKKKVIKDPRKNRKPPPNFVNSWR